MVNLGYVSLNLIAATAPSGTQADSLVENKQAEKQKAALGSLPDFKDFRAVEELNTLVSRSFALPHPLAQCKAEKAPEIQRILNRWSEYLEEIEKTKKPGAGVLSQIDLAVRSDELRQNLKQLSER